MNAGALTTTVARSTASGAASGPGASPFAPDKGAATGQVDAFTQALAALLGLPAQPTPQGDVASPAQAAGAVQGSGAAAHDASATPVFTSLVANGAAGPQGATQAQGFVLSPNGALAADQSLLADTLTQTITAAVGAGRPAQAQLAGPASPPAAARTLAAPPPAGPSAAQAASASLATVSLAGRIRSDIVTPPGGGGAPDGTAGAASNALTPLAAGATRLDLMLQPVSVAPAKPAPPPGPTKTTAKTDSTAGGTQGASAAPAEDASTIEALHAPLNTADEQGQQGGEHAGGGTAAPNQSAQQTAPNTNPNAEATSLAVAPGVAAPQGAASLATAATPIASQLATQVIKAAEGKSTHFDIALDPAGLGRVDVKLQIDAQGQVSAQFSFASTHTAAEAKAQAGQLQQALEQAGFTVGQGGLSFDVGGQGASLARQDSQPAPQLDIGPSALSSPAEAAPVASPTFVRSPASGLDITI